MLLKTLLLTLCIVAGAVAHTSPVFLWNAATEAKPSLATVTQEEFADVLEPLLQTKTIIAFIEDELTARDLTCHNVADNKAQTCFAHLSSVTPKTYYASVEQPLETLTQLAKHKEFNFIDKDGQFLHPVKLSAKKVIFVSFKTPGDLTRGATLAAHDAAMQAVSKQLKGELVFVYLSAGNSEETVSRARRSTAASTGGYIFRDGANFLLFFSSLSYKANGATTKEVLDISSMTVTGNASSLTAPFNVSLTASTAKVVQFQVKYDGGYYNLINVNYDGVNFADGSLFAPLALSYHCGNLILKPVIKPLDTNNARLYWNGLQFQAPFGTVGNATFVFGDSWDCVPFFTPGILSALFVSIFLLAVVFIGVCWMMDINTMDRFEDAKGKTITVNTGAD